MTTVPTDAQIIKEIHQTINANPQFKQCVNCMHYNRITQVCDKLHARMLPYVPGCRHYDTAEAMLLRITKEELTEQARECEKIEFLLAISLTVANMTSLFIEDFERSVKKVYEREKKKGSASHLRKDLDLAKQMDTACDKILKSLGEIEKQYRHYFQAHVDKIFKKEGVYNVEKHDQFHASAGECAIALLEKVKEEHERNHDTEFCMNAKDIEHYRLK